jgi:small-conductance mechanosensitive channel
MMKDLLAQLPGSPTIHAVVLLVGSLVLAWLVDLAISRAVGAWARRTKTALDDRIVAIIHRPIFVTVVFAGLWVTALALEIPDDTRHLVLRLLATLLLLLWFVFALRATSLVLAALSGRQDTSAVVQPRTLPLIDNVAKLVLLGAAVYVFLVIWQIDVTPWLASAGIAGIALGFAAKDTLGNLFAGLSILADAPFKVGDFVVIESGERGQVTHIGLRSTRLLTRDDIEITIPNATLATAKIVNESGGPWEKERVRVKVSVAYGSDVDQVRQVLLDIGKSNEQVAATPAPRVRLRSFGDSGVDFELLCWIEEPVLRGRVLDALNTAVYKRFHAEGIEIPYPKRDVYVHTATPPEGGDG